MQLLVDTCILYDWLMGEIGDRHAIEVIETQGAYVSGFYLGAGDQANERRHARARGRR